MRADSGVWGDMGPVLLWLSDAGVLGIPDVRQTPGSPAFGSKVPFAWASKDTSSSSGPAHQHGTLGALGK